jgi:hypothetical protein
MYFHLHLEPERQSTDFFCIIMGIAFTLLILILCLIMANYGTSLWI